MRNTHPKQEKQQMRQAQEVKEGIQDGCMKMIKMKNSKPRRLALKQSAINDYHSGMTVKELAIKYDKSEPTIYRWLSIDIPGQKAAQIMTVVDHMERLLEGGMKVQKEALALLERAKADPQLADDPDYYRCVALSLDKMTKALDSQAGILAKAGVFKGEQPSVQVGVQVNFENFSDWPKMMPLLLDYLVAHPQERDAFLGLLKQRMGE